tara:strand:+ start:553 stop:759 length:207 start_codon:yes stop_codon:yes gene_type:complete
MEYLFKKYKIKNKTLVKNALMGSDYGVLIFLVDHAEVSFEGAVHLLLTLKPEILQQNLKAFFYGEENV